MCAHVKLCARENLHENIEFHVRIGKLYVRTLHVELRANVNSYTCPPKHTVQALMKLPSHMQVYVRKYSFTSHMKLYLRS